MMNVDLIEQKGKKGQAPIIPQSITDSIPYVSIHESGIMEVRPGLFSQSYLIPAVNFKTATDDRQRDLIVEYSEFLNAFDAAVSAEITIFNQILEKKTVNSKNNLKTEKILTVTVEASDIGAAIGKLTQIETMLADKMVTMTNTATTSMTMAERLDLLSRIYNQDNARPVYTSHRIDGCLSESFTLANCAAQGSTTKELIAPETLEFRGNNGQVGECMVKAYCVSSYPTHIKKTILTDFAQLPTNGLVSVYFTPMDQAEGLKLVKRSTVEEADLFGPLTKNNQKIFMVTFLIVLFAKDNDELKGFEEQMKLIGNNNLLTIHALNLQQEAGFNSALPIGNNTMRVQRLLSTSSVASIIPFDNLFAFRDGYSYPAN